MKSVDSLLHQPRHQFFCIEATDVILEYSLDAKELLGRQKMKWEVLFQYLHDEVILLVIIVNLTSLIL